MRRLIKRDISQLFTRIEQLQSQGWRVSRHGDSKQNYPIYSLERAAPLRRPTILLVGGIHGNEPAGTEAALLWLENLRLEEQRFGWLVIPCANPTGWESNRRTNSLGKDINRHFRNPTCCHEAAAIREAIQGRQFIFSMDFHEDTEAAGYYICEIRKSQPFAGERIVKAVSPILPIWRMPRLDGRKAASGGCVRRFPVSEAILQRRRLWPLEFYLLRAHTSHTFCSETPVGFPMEKRIAAHHAALQVACQFADELI